ncbi:MAG: tRNA (N(6)-L-threonylcarbamoyladenosine(37)-C(2))-methylthiotransferase MtaB [Bacillota bacterium]|nr:tRNA (N(6)-L-threonylcarbamoyladenosine(37)-C(2))-methylthiotransferase MtaB [Bacillota bacterium]
MAKTVAFYTLGCKVNQYETESMSEMFKSCGYEIRGFEEFADVYVINTCSVTSLADRKSRTQIRKAKKINKNAIVVVCGCYSQTNPEAVEAIPDVDIVIGSSGKGDIVSIVEQKGEEKIFKVNDIMEQKVFEDSPVTGHNDKTRAFMKIQDGCDNYCTYCIIPYARGHVRSRSLESIKKEAEEFARKGFKEIVLTGIHITSYGKETGEYTLLDVLRTLHGIEEIKRIRLGSLEFTPELIKIAENFAQFPKLCNHFHVSLQSGCNETLRRMGRRYTAEEYMEGIHLLCKAFPNAAITTDIMVGFPGETLEEFMQSRDFAEKAEFAKMHIFPYSARSGTRAAKMDGQIDKEIKKKRVELLESLNKKNIRLFARKQVAKLHKVLFEQEEGGYYVGHTTNYLLVYVKSNRDITKEIHSVRVKAFKDDKLYGDIEE